MARRSLSLSVKLPLLIAVVVLLTAIVGGVLIVQQARAALEDQSLDAARERVRGYSGAVTAHLTDSALVLETGATDPEVAAFAENRAAAQAFAEGVLEASDVFEFVVLTDRTGTVAVVAPSDPHGLNSTPSVARTTWFLAMLDRGDTVVSDLHVSLVTHRPSVVIATPIRDRSGLVVGAVVGGLGLGSFSAFAPVSDRGDSAGGEGLLTDRRGLIIAHQANPEYIVNQTDFSSVPAVRSALAGRAGTGTWYNPIERTTKLGAYLPLPDTGWAVVVATPLHEALAPVDGLIKVAAGVGGIAGVVLCGIGAAFARRLTRPLRRLATASERAATGDLTVRVDAGGGGEVGELANRFNTMLDTLQANDESLQRRARELQASNEELDAFSYSVSHDLRAPLRAIDGFGQILVEDHADTLAPEALEHIDRMRAATQRMGDLIDDLLTLARIGQAELAPRRVDLSGTADMVVAELRDGEPHRRVSVTIEPGLTTSADPRLAEVVLRNLLGNAWKFTSRSEDPRISLEAAAVPEWFMVTDNGAGFDMTQAERLFEPFRRLHAAAAFPGSGVGLATVRRILRRHGGRIQADAAPGSGARFSFTFAPSDQAPPTVLGAQAVEPAAQPQPVEVTA